jgi:hypothetical protein
MGLGVKLGSRVGVMVSLGWTLAVSVGRWVGVALARSVRTGLGDWLGVGKLCMELVAVAGRAVAGGGGVGAQAFAPHAMQIMRLIKANQGWCLLFIKAPLKEI